MQCFFLNSDNLINIWAVRKTEIRPPGEYGTAGSMYYK